VLVNPEVDASWQAPVSVTPAPKRTARQIMKHGNPVAPAICLSQRQRNRAIDLLQLLRCPACHAESLKTAAGNMVCKNCNQQYSVEWESLVWYLRLGAVVVHGTPKTDVHWCFADMKMR